MEPIVLPALYCPFKIEIHPYSQEIGNQSIDWALHLNMITNEHISQTVRSTQFDKLVGQAYPQISLQSLRFISDWSLWLLLWDDICGQTDICDQPRKQAAMHRHLLAILNGADITLPQHPLDRGLYDLRERMKGQLSAINMQRFIYAVADTFRAGVWEAHNRSHRRIPDIATYLQKRILTSALFTYLEIFELSHDATIDQAAQDHPSIREINRKANNVICWCNDIISYHKEIQQGDTHNLVILFQYTHHISPQEAIDRVATLHDTEVSSYLQLESSLSETDMIMNTDLRRYLSLLRSWMSANLHWSLQSGRYRPPTHEMAVGQSSH